ncbi:MAG: hypothetical protein RL094_576 [Candidatus Parcubacteria bacterium]|jgi:queuine tRNA-ribosyltransferase
MSSPLKFTITHKLTTAAGEQKLGRAGELVTPHGTILTPAFVSVGTKATIKAITPEMLATLGAQVCLANTYHLYLQPGDDVIKKAGGLHKFMNWHGPTMTDSGGFQAFSLGAAYGKNISKLTKSGTDPLELPQAKSLHGEENPAMHAAKIDANGVMFKSIIDGSVHYFTPEKSIEIQHNIGADMIFAFDECTSPNEPFNYQREALDRTHRWAKRSLQFHKDNAEQASKQALFGIVQGGRHEELRKESAQILADMTVDVKSMQEVVQADGSKEMKEVVATHSFDGFGIGGSFAKEDMITAVSWVNSILPEDKPRHLLGIGEPEDLFGAVENGCDLFDCVMPTRNARNGTLLTKIGKLNMTNAKYGDDFTAPEEGCGCYTCTHYTRAYLAHLFRAKEMLGGTLATIHNLYFTINLVKNMRAALVEGPGKFDEFKTAFLQLYKKDRE